MRQIVPTTLFLGSALIAAASARAQCMFLRKADAKPSTGSAVDHVGFSIADLDAKMKEFESAGVKVVTLPNGPAINFSYVAGPAGARIEIVERPGLKPGE